MERPLAPRMGPEDMLLVLAHQYLLSVRSLKRVDYISSSPLPRHACLPLQAFMVADAEAMSYDYSSDIGSQHQAVSSSPVLTSETAEHPLPGPQSKFSHQLRDPLSAYYATCLG